MTAHRPGQGSVSPGGPSRRPTTHAAPARPTTLFKRSDKPFGGGEGQAVSLIREQGYTAQGFLDVPFRMQCPPIDSISQTEEHSHQTFQVIGGPEGPEERSMSAGPKLKTVSFKTLFLNWQPSWAIWPSPDPRGPEEPQETSGAVDPALLEPLLAVAELQELCKRGIKFRLLISNYGLYDHDDVNMVAVILSANAEEVAGEPDCRYLTVSFQEWKPTEIERLSVKNTLGPWNHKIVPGDSLYSIARRYYKTQTLWPLIASANPGMGNLAPSSNVYLWGKRNHRSSVKVPTKPVTSSPNVNLARGIVLP